MFFEGTEKKAYIETGSNAPSLRSLERGFWVGMLARCNAKILSSISNEHVDSYLLSESCLFVWHNRLMIITCGQSDLVEAATYFIESFGRANIEQVIFQRKNEYLPRLQKSSFLQDSERLNQLMAGTALRFGRLDSHHSYLWHANTPEQPNKAARATDLLMYHISGKIAQYLRSANQSRLLIRELLQLDRLFPGFEFDDYLFQPFGYSMNGIRGDQYITMHITPQQNCSYVSFETDLDIPRECPALLEQLLQIFQPESYDLLTVNSEAKLSLTNQDGIHCLAKYFEPLSCGNQVGFEHFICEAHQVQRATSL